MTAARFLRPVALGAALATAGALALASAPTAGGPSGPAALGPGQASAADCVPVRRSKTVVKRVKVKRHGRVVKVKRKRKKRWTVCVPVPPDPAPKTCDLPSSNLGVIARDSTGSSFTLSRNCVTAGQVTVQLNNQGEDPHNVWLRPLTGADPGYSIPADPPYELGPMSQDDGTFTLTVGQWYLWCDLLLHEEQGMNAQLTVG